LARALDRSVLDFLGLRDDGQELTPSEVRNRLEAIETASYRLLELLGSTEYAPIEKSSGLVLVQPLWAPHVRGLSDDIAIPLGNAYDREVSGIHEFAERVMAEWSEEEFEVVRKRMSEAVVPPADMEDAIRGVCRIYRAAFRAKTSKAKYVGKKAAHRGKRDLDAFLSHLCTIYERFTDREPGFSLRRGNTGDDATSEVYGPFLRFLTACLEPILVKYGEEVPTPKALRSRWLRIRNSNQL
ncbi:MAG: hypothetical protein KC466_21255, partial [Myxococcales bacterium]|nr:hypothetical protein [Myxococcales bacterium]